MDKQPDPALTMSIDIKKNRLRVHKTTLRILGDPPFVQLLFSIPDHSIVVRGRRKQEPGGRDIRVIFDKPRSVGTFDIYSKELVTCIRNQFPMLNQSKLYRLHGFQSLRNQCVCFPLESITGKEAKDV